MTHDPSQPFHPPPPAHDPRQDLPQRVTAGLAKLALVFRHQAWRATGAHGLSPTQAQILAVIAGSPERSVGIRALADRLAITMGTVSAAVSTLVDKGLVAKERAEHDARAVTLGLTPDGQRIAASAGEWPEAILGAVAAMPERDQVGLVRGLVALIRELQARGSVPTARMCVECRYFRPHQYPGAAKAHHCAYVDAPIADADLRIDCNEMEPLSVDERARLWDLFVHGRRLDDAAAPIRD